MNNDNSALAAAREEAAAARDIPRRTSEDRWVPKEPAEEGGQVYSLRIPASRLAQLKKIADRVGKKPTVLMREWVLECLDRSDGEALATKTNLAKQFYKVDRGRLVHTGEFVMVGTPTMFDTSTMVDTPAGAAYFEVAALFTNETPVVTVVNGPVAATSIATAITRSKHST